MGCRDCHSATYANGDAVVDSTYVPGCYDCHDQDNDFDTPEAQCLSCHGRQGAENGWVDSGKYTNVHADTLGCPDCHMPNEENNIPGLAAFDDMHSMGHTNSESYASMLSDGAMNADCENCHDMSGHTGVVIHNDKVHCAACHAESVISCYNCHLDSKVEGHVKRAFTKINDFIMLANRDKDGKVYPMSFQSLTYEDSLTWVAFGPFTPHAITDTARTCDQCHINKGGTPDIEAITQYNDNHEIVFAEWNDEDTSLSHIEGVVPMPVDYQTQLKMDFITYTGDVHAPAGPSKEWKAIGQNTLGDRQQMLFATPLTTAQMEALGMDISAVSVGDDDFIRPSKFALKQNYPNPFNPSTTIEFDLPFTTEVTMVVFDVLGKEVSRIYNKEVVKAGNHKINFDASRLASGIYFYQIRTKNFVKTRKMFMLK